MNTLANVFREKLSQEAKVELWEDLKTSRLFAVITVVEIKLCSVS